MVEVALIFVARESLTEEVALIDPDAVETLPEKKPPTHGPCLRAGPGVRPTMRITRALVLGGSLH